MDGTEFLKGEHCILWPPFQNNNCAAVYFFGSSLALFWLLPLLFLALHVLYTSVRIFLTILYGWIGAKYTDEGWYGDGAIRHFQRGAWHGPRRLQSGSCSSGLAAD